MIETLNFLEAVEDELERATEENGPFRSAHKAYAVILEETDEFWEEVRLKGSERSPHRMRRELIQIAAMACRASIDLGLEEES